MKSKEEAGYREGTEKKCCGNCEMYRPQTETCTTVRGLIRAEDLCDYWTKKSK